MQNIQTIKRRLLASAVMKVAGKLPPDARLGFSQGAIAPAELAEEIISGKIRGTHFYGSFEAVRQAQCQSFSQAIHDLVETPPLVQRGGVRAEKTRSPS